MDVDKPLDRTTSLLEFLLIAISKSLNLNPKQAAALLSNGNKYLAHILVKGVKSQFQPIVTLMEMVIKKYNNILLLI